MGWTGVMEWSHDNIIAPKPPIRSITRNFYMAIGINVIGSRYAYARCAFKNIQYLSLPI